MSHEYIYSPNAPLDGQNHPDLDQFLKLEGVDPGLVHDDLVNATTDTLAGDVMHIAESADTLAANEKVARAFFSVLDASRKLSAETGLPQVIQAPWDLHRIWTKELLSNSPSSLDNAVEWFSSCIFPTKLLNTLLEHADENERQEIIHFKESLNESSKNYMYHVPARLGMDAALPLLSILSVSHPDAILPIALVGAGSSLAGAVLRAAQYDSANQFGRDALTFHETLKAYINNRREHSSGYIEEEDLGTLIQSNIDTAMQEMQAFQVDIKFTGSLVGFISGSLYGIQTHGLKLLSTALIGSGISFGVQAMLRPFKESFSKEFYKQYEAFDRARQNHARAHRLNTKLAPAASKTAYRLNRNLTQFIKPNNQIMDGVKGMFPWGVTALFWLMKLNNTPGALLVGLTLGESAMSRLSKTVPLEGARRRYQRNYRILENRIGSLFPKNNDTEYNPVRLSENDLTLGRVTLKNNETLDLSGVTIPADHGMVIIQGENGKGKSTVLRKIAQMLPRDKTSTSWANQDTEDRLGLECIERLQAGKLEGFREYLQSITHDESRYRLGNLIRAMRSCIDVGNSSDVSLRKRLEFGMRILSSPRDHSVIMERWKVRYASPIRPLPAPLTQTLDFLLLSYIRELIPNANPGMLYNKIEKDYGSSSGQASRTRLLFCLGDTMSQFFIIDEPMENLDPQTKKNITWALAAFIKKHPEKMMYIVPNDELLLHYMTQGYLYTHIRGVLDINDRTFTRSADVKNTLGFALLDASTNKREGSLQEVMEWLPTVLDEESHRIPFEIANRLLNTISSNHLSALDPNTFRQTWNSFFLELSKRDPSWCDFFKNKLPIGFGESSDVMKTLRDREYALAGKYMLLRALVAVVENNIALKSLKLSDEKEALSLIPASLTTRETLLQTFETIDSFGNSFPNHVFFLGSDGDFHRYMLYAFASDMAKTLGKTMPPLEVHQTLLDRFPQILYSDDINLVEHYHDFFAIWRRGFRSRQELLDGLLVFNRFKLILRLIDMQRIEELFRYIHHPLWLNDGMGHTNSQLTVFAFKLLMTTDKDMGFAREKLRDFIATVSEEALKRGIDRETIKKRFKSVALTEDDL